MARLIKEATEVLYNPKIKNNKKIKKIKKNLYGPKKKDEYYRPIKINGAFDDNYIEYQSNGNEDKILSIKEYLNINKPYLSNIVNDHKEEWKIQLMMEINFATTEESIKIHEMYIRSKNRTILIGHETDEIIEELFDSLLQKYQCALENTQEESNHVFDSINALYYKLHKTSLHRGGSYIYSPE